MAVEYRSYDFNNIPVKRLIIQSSATAPASPVADQLWTDTSVTPHLVKMYDGATWVPLGFVADGSITDAKIAANAAIALSKLATNPLARANHTGTQLAATISDLAATVQGYSLSDFAAVTGDLDLGGNQLTNVGAPTAGTDAANRDYVDSASAGFRGTKDPVRVVAAPGYDVNNPGAAIDGVTLANGDRFLVPDDGIYVFNGAGTPATVDDDGVMDGTTVAVAEGTAAGQIWIQRATDPATAADWGVFNAGGLTYTAGTGLSLAGTQFSLPNVSIANGGTGATTAAGARTNLGAAAAYGETVASGDFAPGVPVTVTHGLNTVYVNVGITNDTTGDESRFDWRVADANSIEITSEVTVADDMNVAVFGVQV